MFILTIFCFHFNSIVLCFPGERLFRLHCKRMVDKFANNVIEAAQRELTVETANKIKSLESNALNLIKPETIKILSKTNALIDKNFTIPETLPIDGDSLQNTPDMDDFERKFKQDIADLELVYKQQAVMMNYLVKEKELYDTKLMEEAEIDMRMCDLFESTFTNSNSTDSNLNAELVDNMVRMLDDIGLQSTSN